jgi:transcriptional regulator with XRE-family HTH domain
MLGARIEQRMAELGISTQTELARRAELSPAHVHALIRGTRGKRVSLAVVMKLSRALRVPQKFFSEDTTSVENSDLDATNHPHTRMGLGDE